MGRQWPWDDDAAELPMHVTRRRFILGYPGRVVSVLFQVRLSASELRDVHFLWCGVRIVRFRNLALEISPNALLITNFLLLSEQISFIGPFIKQRLES